MSAAGRRRGTVVAGAALAALVAVAVPAAAHPLGNFTTNTAAALLVRPDRIDVDYVLDLAEIPALRVVQLLDADRDGAVSHTEGAVYERRECETLARGVTLAADDRPLEVEVQRTLLAFPPGEAGLATLRLECALSAEVALAAPATLSFHDGNRDTSRGWREVTAAGVRTTLVESDVPAESPSNSLRSYPAERLEAPSAVRDATLVVRPGGAAPAGAGAAGEPGSERGQLDHAFTRLVAARELTAGVGVLAVLAALVLGGLHALAPGHGKTVMAAYMVSRDASARQLLGLALTVAVAHTTGVLLLGAVLGVTEILAPQRLFGWLGVASGLLFAVVGVTLLRTNLARHRHPHAHEPAGAGGHLHDHDHPHDHLAGPHGHGHEPHHGHSHGHGQVRRRLGWRGFVAPGLAGGLVPTPSALVVLLGGMALDRTWFGVLLVLTYGLGMAAVLVGAGWVLLHARERLAAHATTGRFAQVARVLPVATAALLVAGGLAIATRAAVAL